MRIISFQGKYIFKITDELTVTVNVDEPDWNNIIERYWGKDWKTYARDETTYPGKDWIKGRVRIEDSMSGEMVEIESPLPIRSKEAWEKGFLSLFNNYIFELVNHDCRGKHPRTFMGIERYTSDQPSVAWMYHKTIYDRVMGGEWASKRISFIAQMEIAREDGEVFKISWDKNGWIRVYFGEKRLGRITIIKKEKENIVGIIPEYPFFLPSEEEVERDVEYRTLFGKTCYEDGVAIVNVKNFSDLVQGIEMAITYFLQNP